MGEVTAIHAWGVSDKNARTPAERLAEQILNPDKQQVLIMRTGKTISDLTLQLLQRIPESDRTSLDWMVALVPENPAGFQDPRDVRELRMHAYRIAESFAKKFRELVPHGRPVRYFTGAFSPGSGQESRIFAAVTQDNDLAQFIAQSDLSFATSPLETVAKHVTTDREFILKKSWLSRDKEFLDDLALSFVNKKEFDILPEEMKIADIQSLYTSLAKSNALSTRAGKFIQFIIDLLPYRTYNVDIASLPQTERAGILSEFTRQVAVPAVEPDIIALYPNDAKDNQALEIIEHYIAMTKGRVFGKRPLLAVGDYSREEQTAARNLFEGIRTGRIHFTIGEIKMLLTRGQKKEDFEKRQNFFEKGVGYRVWGMVQQLLAVYSRESRATLSSQVQEFLLAVKELSRPPEKGTRIGQIRFAGGPHGAIRSFIKGFLNEDNHIALIVGKWPIFFREGQMTYSTRREKNETEFRWHLNIPKSRIVLWESLPSSSVYKLVRHAGRTMLQKLSTMKRLRTYLHEVKKGNVPDVMGISQDPGLAAIVESLGSELVASE